jgi:peptidoglycan/LPS O-acetylase OafA/YrhL
MALSMPTQLRPAQVSSSKQSSLRLDIQGLRAVAVLAVIADHLFGYPVGGFVGVDVFFVISGFLITGLMLREHDRTGRISWTSFYRRRAKRIMPAAVVVLVATVVASYAIFLASRATTVLLDAVWAALFTSNWRFAAIGTDYWQNDGPVSPLRHFWSLAVEEQFYIAWPILMIAVFALAARIGTRAAKIVLFVAMSILAVASLVWALYETATNPTVAYFSTFSRAWELAVGALLAVLAPLLARIPWNLRTPLSYVGFAGIVASIFLVTPESAFPAPWALAPVLSCAVVIAAGTGETPRGIPWLTNRVSAYLGNISYSLYLWHFPVLTLAAALTPPGSLSYLLWSLGITFYLSIATYHFVEDPIRKSLWLESKAKKAEARRRRKKRVWFSEDLFFGLPKVGLVGLLAGPAIAVALIALTVHAPQPSEVAIPAAAPLAGTSKPSEAPSIGPATDEISKQISAALSSREWPELSPSTLSDSAADWPADEYGSCLIKNYDRADGCVFGPANATKSIAVLGDSLGARLVYLLHKVYPDYRIHGFVRSGCIATDVVMTARSAEDAAGCAADRKSAIEATNTLGADLVFIINNGGGVRELQSKAKGSVASDEWAAGLAKTVNSIEGDHSRVVVVSPPPEGKKLEQCATKVSKPADCAATVSADWKVASAGEAKGAAQSGAKYLNTIRWYCSAANSCPAFVGTTIVKRDSVHPTAPFLDKLVGPMKESLGAAGIPSS